MHLENVNSLTVGWEGYAEYTVTTDPPSIVGSLGDVDLFEGALCGCLSVLPLALPLFDLEPLHGSAVQTSAGAVLLLGDSGAGKSSLVAALAARGLPFAADDVCAVDGDGVLWPGAGLIGLADPGRAMVVGRYNEKAIVRPATTSTHPGPVRAIIALRPIPDAELAVVPLTRSESLKAILARVRAPRVLIERRRDLQFQVATDLSAHAHVAELTYDQQRHTVDETAETLITWAQSNLAPFATIQTGIGSVSAG